MLIRLVISLTADQCAKGAAMLLDVSNPACSLRESPCWSFLLGLTPLTADTKRSWAHWWCALHWGLLKQTAMQPVHTRSISSVSLIMLCFPGRENLNFQMLSATSQGYLKNNWQGQTSMPILSDLSAAAAIGHGCFWYVCSCLCEGPELHDWLVSFLLSERTQMAVLADRSHAPKDCLLAHVTKQLYCVTPPFQPEKAIPRTAQSSLERRTLLSLPGLPGSWCLGQWHQQKMWRGSGTVTLLTSELQIPAKNKWGCHNNPNSQHYQRSLPNCSSGKMQ